MPSAAAVLMEHEVARQEWLRDACEVLSADRRVRAVVLYGSLARDVADAWSDVDLVVIIDDASLDDVVATRHDFGVSFGDAVYSLDSFWNAPLDGAQVNVLYRLRSGLPLYVDWNLWPTSLAQLPRDTKLLFARGQGDVAPVDATFEQWSTFERQRRPTREDADAESLRHAWFGMVPIAAKFFARRDRSRLVRLLEGIGAGSILDSPTAEIDAIRERLRALSPGESAAATEAITVLCDIAATTRGR